MTKILPDMVGVLNTTKLFQKFTRIYFISGVQTSN